MFKINDDRIIQVLGHNLGFNKRRLYYLNKTLVITLVLCGRAEVKSTNEKSAVLFFSSRSQNSEVIILLLFFSCRKYLKIDF